MSEKPKTSPRVWVLRLLLLVLAPVVTLGLLEGGLRLIGSGYDPHFFVEDDVDKANLRNNDSFTWRFFPRALARTLQPIRLTKEKPANSHRIVLMGGSAAMGDPQPAYGMARVLQQLLEYRYPEQGFEVINTAVTAINSHVVLSIAEDCVDLEADLWLAYLGNNEVMGPYGSASVFGSSPPGRKTIRANLGFQKTRLGQWMAGLRAGDQEGVPSSWGGMAMFEGQDIPFDAPDLKRVQDNFRSNLQDIVALAKKHGIPLILSSVAVNLADSAPFVSLHDPDNAAAIDFHLENRRWTEAEAACRSALAEHSDSANTHYWLGKALIGQGKTKEARDAFQRACDLDALRFRTDSRLNAIIREVGASVPHFVDGEQVLAEADQDGIPGREFFHEHVHLTYSGNYHLCLAFAAAAEKAFGLSSTQPWLTEAECARALGHTVFHEREILKEMRQRLRTPPFVDQWGQEERDRLLVEQADALSKQLTPAMGQQAMAEFQKQLTKAPDDWIARQQFATLLNSTGKHAEEVEQWEAIVQEIPHDPNAHYQLGASRNRLKDWKGAETALLEAVRLRDRHPKAWNSLGICLSRQDGRKTEAYASFQRAVDVDPSMAEALMNWGLALQSGNELEAAEAKFEQAILANPKHIPSYGRLGTLLAKASKFKRASEVYAKVVELLPEDPSARINLALAQIKLGNKAAAIQEFETCLRLDPNNQLARNYLQQLR